MDAGHLPRTLVRDIGSTVGDRIRLCGWAQAHDLPGSLLLLRDHTGHVPVVAGSRRGAALSSPPEESAVEVTGRATVEGGQVRVEADAVHVAGAAASPLPVTPESPLEDRLDWRYLDLRRPRNRLIFAVQTTAEHAMRAFWHEHGFLEVHSPKLKPIPNKSGDELFAVDYFDRRAWLAQSPQFYKQMAMAAGFDRVFEIGPVFRAQRDPTSRHDTEFTSVDIEIAWIDDLEDLLVLEERLLRAVLEAVAAEHGEDIVRWFGTEVRVPPLPFPRLTLDEAKEVVASSGWPVAADADDLDPEGEQRLAAYVARKHGHEFVFVTDYPDLSRPFYHMRCRDDSVATRSYDLLWKGLEITSGAQREHRYDRLVAQARARGVPVDAVHQYLDFFKYGCPPHGGFGLGLTRMLVSLFGVGDVREVTYLFRGPDRLSP